MSEAEDEWRPIPDFPWYEINLLGNIQYTDTKVPLTPSFTIQGKYYHLLKEGTAHLLRASLLVELAFPELGESK